MRAINLTVDELREDSDDKLFFSARYNPNHVLHRLLPQPKTIEHNLRQRTHNLTLPMDVNAILWNKTLYIECCSETFINAAFMFYSHLYIFPQTIQCISHLLFRCCMCVCHMLLKNYLLTYLLTYLGTGMRAVCACRRRWPGVRVDYRYPQRASKSEVSHKATNWPINNNQQAARRIAGRATDTLCHYI